MLLAYAKRLRTQAVTTQTSDIPIGTLTVIEAYPQLRYADLEGVGQVQLDATGNMVGFSPVERCQDAQGETAWIPTELLRNIRLSPFQLTGSARSHATGASAAPNTTRSRTRSRRPAAAKPATA